MRRALCVGLCSGNPATVHYGGFVSVALVTGSAGLIGSGTVRHLAGVGLTLARVANDMRAPVFQPEAGWGIGQAGPCAQAVRGAMRLGACRRAVLGASKVAADVMVRASGRYVGWKTACCRGGSLAGRAHAAPQLHGFLAYVMRCSI